MVKVKILGMVITNQYGVLNTGDILSTSEEFAKHLVDDCGAAEYLKVEAKQEPVEQKVKPSKADK